MLQRSSLPSTSTAEIADTLGRSLAERAWAGGRWQAIQDWLPLPTTWRQYLLACLALAVVMGGMLLHILLSVQIAHADLQLRQMRETYARVERQNSELVYQIAQRSSLAHMAQLAAQQGYVPATGRTYAVRPDAVAIDPVRGDLSPQAVTPAAQRQPAPGAGSAAGAAAPTWQEQIGRWWQDAGRAAGAATTQLWRDITGRME
jgi:hypothetical protein